MPSDLLPAATVARRAGLAYQTLLFWLRRGFVRAETYPGRQWQVILFTEDQAQAVIAKAARVRELRRALAAEFKRPARRRAA